MTRDARLPDNAELLPCGCWMGTSEEDGAFVMQPCAPDCKYYRYALEGMKAQGKPVMPNVAPFTSPEALRAYGLE